MPVFKEEYDQELPLFSPTEFSPDIFEDLNNHIKKTEFLIEERREDLKKIEKLSSHIEQAREILEKAKLKREALLRKNTDLKVALEEDRQRVALSVKYWNDFGFQVVEISRDDNSEEYEYIFSKLGGDQSIVTEDNQEFKHTIGLKFYEKHLEIVSQSPQVLDSETLTALNEKLTSNCLSNDFKTVNYRSAMILIKKTLISALTKIPQPAAAKSVGPEEAESGSPIKGENIA